MAPTQAARDLGAGTSTRSKWLKDARDLVQRQAVTKSEKEELKRLRKEVHYLKVERDILKMRRRAFPGLLCPKRAGHEEQRLGL